jgi:hypothetical protein
MHLTHLTYQIFYISHMVRCQVAVIYPGHVWLTWEQWLSLTYSIVLHVANPGKKNPSLEYCFFFFPLFLNLNFILFYCFYIYLHVYTFWGATPHPRSIVSDECVSRSHHKIENVLSGAILNWGPLVLMELYILCGFFKKRK